MKAMKARKAKLSLPLSSKHPKSMRSLTFTLILFAPAILLPAHPISISWATLHASKEKIGLQLNVLAEDLFLYQGLEPDENGFFPAEQLSQAAERHSKFLSQYFFLEGLQGQRLTSKFLGLQAGDIPAEGIHKDSLMQHSLLYFFEFKTPPSMAGVQVRQQFGGSLSPIPALVMVTAYQEGASGSLTAELNRERPWVVRFNWDNPEFFARNKGFGQFAAQESHTVSVHIDEAGIRQEVVLPFDLLETLLPLNGKEPSLLSNADKQEAIAFFTKRITVTANGQPAVFSSSRVAFEAQQQHPDSEGLAPGTLPDTPVRISLFYPATSPLASVSVNWEAFNWQARTWTAEIEVFGKKESHTFSRYRPEYAWKR